VAISQHGTSVLFTSHPQNGLLWIYTSRTTDGRPFKPKNLTCEIQNKHLQFTCLAHLDNSRVIFYHFLTSSICSLSFSLGISVITAELKAGFSSGWEIHTFATEVCNPLISVQIKKQKLSTSTCKNFISRSNSRNVKVFVWKDLQSINDDSQLGLSAQFQDTNDDAQGIWVLIPGYN
jgi:hypothetical protein